MPKEDKLLNSKINGFLSKKISQHKDLDDLLENPQHQHTNISSQDFSR